MKKNDLISLINQFAAPVLIILLGLILLLSPDSASALVGKIFAWIAILGGLGFAAAAVFGDPLRRPNRIIWAAIFLCGGILILRNPTLMAKFIGRVLGLAILIQGARDINRNYRYSGKRIVFTPGFLLAAATSLVGLVLVVLPMTASRMVFSVCGIVLLCIGVAELYDRVKGRRLLNAGDDPDIIDVDPL